MKEAKTELVMRYCISASAEIADLCDNAKLHPQRYDAMAIIDMCHDMARVIYNAASDYYDEKQTDDVSRNVKQWFADGKRKSSAIFDKAHEAIMNDADGDA
jgi:hypothetical protein